MEEQTEYKAIDRRPNLESENLPATQGPNQDNFMIMIERLSSRPDIDVTKIEKLMDMHERILDRTAEQAFNADFVQAQREIQTVIRTKMNTQTGSKYAPLENIERDGKPVWTKWGFGLMFYEGFSTPDNPIKDGYVRIMCDIMHKGGHTKVRFSDLPIDDKGIKGNLNKTLIHAKGSTFSYGRRYLTCMIFNIPTGDDDDGNSAGGPVTEFITDEQRIQIEKVIVEKKIDAEKFLQYFGVEEVSNIPIKEFNRVINTLKKAKGTKKENGESS